MIFSGDYGDDEDALLVVQSNRRSHLQPSLTLDLEPSKVTSQTLALETQALYPRPFTKVPVPDPQIQYLNRVVIESAEPTDEELRSQLRKYTEDRVEEGGGGDGEEGWAEEEGGEGGDIMGGVLRGGILGKHLLAVIYSKTLHLGWQN